MTLARRRALLIVSVLIAAATMLSVAVRQRSAAQPAKPDLLILTSLPLLFNEDFDPRRQGSPALQTLSRQFNVVPISTSGERELAKGRLLLMAQAPAQSPEDLVALDDWVRGGGSVLLLADPMLEWPSERPLGDPLRPPVMFTDTGLLAHWGLKLDAPDRRGRAQRILAGRAIDTISPGLLEGQCNIGVEGFVATCAIGKGHAVVVADADFLNAQPGSPALSAMADILAWLSRNDSQRTDLSTGVRARTSQEQTH